MFLNKFLMRYKLLLLTLIFFSCTNKYSGTNKIYKTQARAFAKQIKKQPIAIDSVLNPKQWIGTTNFGMRKPSFVIIHHTAQNSCEQTLEFFSTKNTQVSAHYLICKDGTVHHLLNDYLRAWHAGLARWGNNTDINSASIGIELDNNGFEPFSNLQIKNLLQLLKHLKNTYQIPSANFIGHADIAPKRKNDPNKNFPWQTLSQSGYGNWYDTTNVNLPNNFDALLHLKLIGYDVKDSIAAIKAFKLHFVQQDSVPIITAADKKIIYQLSKN
jgi:N-acetylmuramoyl-L-alanine amidase